MSTRLTTKQYAEDFLLQVDSIQGPGSYRRAPQFTGLVRPVPIGFALQDNRTTEATQGLALSTTATGRIVLTQVDTVRRVMAGTFEGQLRQTGTPNATRELTQGRFDIRY